MKFITSLLGFGFLAIHTTILTQAADSNPLGTYSLAAFSFEANTILNGIASASMRTGRL